MSTYTVILTLVCQNKVQANRVKERLDLVAEDLYEEMEIDTETKAIIQEESCPN